MKVSGAKSSRLNYRIDGKERLLVIGNCPAVTLANGQTFETVGVAFLAKQRKEGKSAATLSKTK